MASEVKTAKNSKLPKLPENCFKRVGKGGWPPISTWIMRRGQLYSCADNCNSPLNNKNTDYHCPVVFSRIGFPHKSLCQLCLVCCSQFYAIFFFVLLPLPNKWYQTAELKDLKAKEKDS
jgi:hypothetical protein